MEGILWMAREGVGEGDGGDPVIGFCYVVTQLPRIYLSALIGHHQNFEIRLRHTLITGPLAQNHSCTEISRHQILKTLIQ